MACDNSGGTSDSARVDGSVWEGCALWLRSIHSRYDAERLNGHGPAQASIVWFSERCLVLARCRSVASEFLAAPTLTKTFSSSTMRDWAFLLQMPAFRST